MEERENRKGPGIFYAVIGVATLVVAIIGATFAYFSVTVDSAANAVSGTTGQGASNNLTLQVQKVSAGNGNLIPLDETTQMGSALGAQSQCVDTNGNTVCQVYSITISNSGDSAVRVAGKLVLTSTAPNMKWELLQNQTTAVSTPTVRSAGDNVAGSVVANELLAASTGSATYYVVVWLHETGAAQDVAGTGTTDEDQTAFTGQVTFSAVDASGNAQGGLTATFSS